MNLIQKGATDVTRYMKLVDATTGQPRTGLTITNLDLQYTRNRTAPAAKVDATALAATDSAHGDNKIIEVDATSSPGLYRVDWPDAAFASGVDKVVLVVSDSLIDPAIEEIQLTGIDVEDAVRGGMSALPNAAADAAGGLPISDAGGLDLDTQLAHLDADITSRSDFDHAADEVTTDAASRTASKADVSGLALASVCTETRLAELDAGNLPTDIAAIPTVMVGTDNAALASVCTETRLAELDAGNLPADVAAIPTTAMRGTDSAALASVCTEARLAELDAGNLPTDVAAIPTVMVGTDNAALASVCTEARLAELDAGNLPTDVAAIADQVWDEPIAGHLGAGSTGEKLNAAASAGDPWSTALPGAYGAGTAGKIVGDNLNAPVGSIPTAPALASVCTEARLAELDAGNLPADVDAIPTTPMRGTDSAATAAALATHDGKLDTVDTVVDAIKAKTDNLPGSPAATGDAMTLEDDAITAAKFDEATAYPVKSADAGATEIARTGADGDTLETISDQIDAIDSAAIADAVWDEAIAGHVGAGSFGAKNQKVVPSESANDYKADVSALALEASLFDPAADEVTTDAASRTASKADVSGLALASVCTEARLAELDAGNLPADVDAIPTTPMRGTDSAALASVCTEGRLAELDAGNLPTDVAAIADQVWDEPIAGHLGAGSTGEKLNAAASAGDPWGTALPGAYGAGTAGKIVGDNLDATVGSVKAKTDGLPADTEARLKEILGASAGKQVLNAAGDEVKFYGRDGALLVTLARTEAAGVVTWTPTWA